MKMNENMKYTYEFLRKCHGLRFKARRYGNDIEGIVKVERGSVVLCYGEETPDNFDYFHRERGVQITPTSGFVGKYVSDFEIVPRDPGTYKDWQVGDKIIKDDTKYSVIFRCGEVVLYKNGYGKACAYPYTCTELFDDGYRLVLTDIEKEILERKVVEDTPKPYEFKKGDLVLTRNDRSAEWKLRVFEGRVDGSDRQFKASVDGFLYIYQYCIPYNEETKHLLGTTEDYKEGE